MNRISFDNFGQNRNFLKLFYFWQTVLKRLKNAEGKQVEVGLNQYIVFDHKVSVQLQLVLTLYTNNLFIKEACPWLTLVALGQPAFLTSAAFKPHWRRPLQILLIATYTSLKWSKKSGDIAHSLKTKAKGTKVKSVFLKLLSQQC